MSSLKIEQLCDMCHVRPARQGHLFPCSGCGIFKYCSPRCQTNHLPQHEKDCKTSQTSGWTGSEYKSFHENEKVSLFLSAFSYHCHIKNANTLPECTVDIKNGVFLAILDENCSIDKDHLMQINPDNWIHIAIGLNKSETTLYNYNMRIFPTYTAKTIYYLYKQLFVDTVKMQFILYQPGCYPKGMKEGAILVIYTNKEGDQKLAHI